VDQGVDLEKLVSGRFLMIKDRFGGLFSGLTKRDLQTLTEFERFLELSIENSIFYDREDPQYRPGEPLLPDVAELIDQVGYEDEDKGPGDWVGDSLEDIYHRFSGYYRELDRQCKAYDTDWSYSIGARPDQQDVTISIKQQCRIWLARVGPVLKKLRKLVDRSQNEALD